MTARDVESVVMPSPFPGMDPYLEAPAFFPDLHDRFVARMSETLQARLPEPYYAVVGSRVWIEASRRSIGPDVEVLRPASAPRGGPGGAAVASRSRPLIIHVPQEEHRETRVEIRSRNEPDEALVAALEVLSLANKTPGVHGRDLNLRKQRELLDGRCHLVEIDLLRGGHHASAVPRERIEEEAGAFDYHVCIRRFDDPEDFFVYAIGLDEALPEVEVPLLPGDGSLPLDLQEVFDHCYDAGPYRRRSPYKPSGPAPPLPPARIEWAEGRLAAWRQAPPRPAG